MNEKIPNGETIIKDIEWKPSRRGLLSPIGILEPIEINGYNIEKVTLFNKEYILNNKIGVGDRVIIKLSKNNIPNFESNITKSGTCVIPNKCPVCNRFIVEVGKDLYCVAKRCIGKKAMFIDHYCTVMKITGLSYHLIMRMLNTHHFNGLEDLYHMKEHKCFYRKLFGREKADMFMNYIEKSKTNCTLEQLIYGLSITGLPTAKAVSKYCRNDLNTFMYLAAKNFDWTEAGIFKYKSDEINDEFYRNYKIIEFLSRTLFIEPYISPEEYNDIFVGMTFVVTGNPEIFNNREEIINNIELHGGRVIGELNEKVTYLVDCGSISGKTKQANELGVDILSEKEFASMIGDV